MDRTALPLGAKGIEDDAFAIEFRDDKIVFVPKFVGGRNTTRSMPDLTRASWMCMKLRLMQPTANSTAHCSPYEGMTSCRHWRVYRRWCRNSLASCALCGWAG